MDSNSKDETSNEVPEPPKPSKDFLLVSGAIEEFLSSHCYKSFVKKLRKVKCWSPEILGNLIKSNVGSEKNVEAVKMLIPSLLREKLVERKQFNEILGSLLESLNLECAEQLNFMSELLYDLLRNQRIEFHDILCIVKPVFQTAMGKEFMLTILGKMFNEIDAFGSLKDPLKEKDERNVIYIEFPGNETVEKSESVTEESENEDSHDFDKILDFKSNENQTSGEESESPVNFEVLDINEAEELENGDAEEPLALKEPVEKPTMETSESNTTDDIPSDIEKSNAEIVSIEVKPSLEEIREETTENSDSLVIVLDFNEMLKSMDLDNRSKVDLKDKQKSSAKLNDNHKDEKIVKHLNSLPGTSKDDLRYYESSKSPQTASTSNCSKMGQNSQNKNQTKYSRQPNFNRQHNQNQGIRPQNQPNLQQYFLGQPLRPNMYSPNQIHDMQTYQMNMQMNQLHNSAIRPPNLNPLIWPQPVMFPNNQSRFSGPPQNAGSLYNYPPPPINPGPSLGNLSFNINNILRPMPIVSAQTKNPLPNDPPKTDLIENEGAASLEFQKYFNQNLQKLQPTLVQAAVEPKEIENKPPEEKPDPNTWVCADCTYRNQNFHDECHMCKGTKPDHDLHNYHQICVLEDADIVPNLEAIECPICFTECKAYEGVTLRDCLHMFCKECLKSHIQMSTDPVVKCPFADETYSCDVALQDREVRAVVTDAIYEKYLEKRLKFAQAMANDSYQCKTADCAGWWVYDPTDTFTNVSCPVCKELNCMICKTIHPGLDCTQYQDLIKSNAEFRDTDHSIREMVVRSEAMPCPQCRVS